MNQNAWPVGSAEIVEEIEGLERELSTLRTRVDEDSSLFASLEEQIADLRKRLGETHDALQARELRLTEKKAQLAEAQRIQRLEAYEDHLARFRDARERSLQAAKEYLRELEAYDAEAQGVRKLLEEMRDVFGGEDERAAAVDVVLAREPSDLGDAWKAVVEATEWRIPRSAAVAEGSAEPGQDKGGDELSEDLQKRAEEGRSSRILDYFSKD